MNHLDFLSTDLILPQLSLSSLSFCCHFFLSSLSLLPSSTIYLQTFLCIFTLHKCFSFRLLPLPKPLPCQHTTLSHSLSHQSQSPFSLHIPGKVTPLHLSLNSSSIPNLNSGQNPMYADTHESRLELCSKGKAEPGNHCLVELPKNLRHKMIQKQLHPLLLYRQFNFRLRPNLHQLKTDESTF